MFNNEPTPSEGIQSENSEEVAVATEESPEVGLSENEEQEMIDRLLSSLTDSTRELFSQKVSGENEAEEEDERRKGLTYLWVARDILKTEQLPESDQKVLLGFVTEYSDAVGM